jgi:hypothetical protein
VLETLGDFAIDYAVATWNRFVTTSGYRTYTPTYFVLATDHAVLIEE